MTTARRCALDIDPLPEARYDVRVHIQAQRDRSSSSSSTQSAWARPLSCRRIRSARARASTALFREAVWRISYLSRDDGQEPVPLAALPAREMIALVSACAGAGLIRRYCSSTSESAPGSARLGVEWRTSRGSRSAGY